MMFTNKPIPENPVPDWEAVSRVPIKENHEPLHPLSLCPHCLVYPAYYKMGIPGALPECFTRTNVYQRLILAGSKLPPGMRLVVLDGWRPYDVQQYLYDTLLNLMKRVHPEDDVADIAKEARNLVSPPSANKDMPSPHLTGGSVDVTLAGENGVLLDMGTLFDEASPQSFTAALENLGNAYQGARHHRRILYHAMIEAGFTNLPTEWWHFDFGNQLWAWHSGEAYALYGGTKPQPLESLWKQQLKA